MLYQAVFVTTIQAPYYQVEQQQAKYKQLFENMTSCGVVYQVVDNGDDFIFLEVNHAAERTEKLARAAFIGRRVTELFPGVVDFGLLEVLSRVWRTGQPEHFPANYYQDGRISGWRENYLYRLSDDHIVSIYDDITERRQAEQALLESERNFRVIFETAAIGMVEADPLTGKFLRVNLKFCQMLGYSEKELLAMTIAMVTHPEDQDSNKDNLRRLLSGDIHEYAFEKRYIHKSGHVLWIHLDVGGLCDEKGRVTRILAAVTDITLRKQAEVDRRRYEQELKSIFDVLPDFYFRLSADGTILSYHANPSVIDELYVPPEQFLNRRLIEVLPQELATQFLHKLTDLKSSGKLITFEYQLKVAAEERYYEARLANLADSGDVIVLIRNIVERKLLEQQLQQAQKMEVLGQMTGGIAHDFNNILAVILGYSSLAQERCLTNPSDKLARYLEEIISASGRARDLIAKMLAYSRTSSSMIAVPLNMSLEVEKAMGMLSIAIPAGIEVVTHIEHALPSVRIDPIDMQQVLVNLVVNARDAIGEQGRIEITLKRTRINHAVCAICHNTIDGDYVVLEVKDSGDGIPLPIQRRIFDPFFTTKEIGKGSGLGLSMVQGVVIKNNAHILINTSFEHGTSFRLLFPFADGDADTQVYVTDKKTALITQHWRIWVVEDHEPLAYYYQEVLQQQGYQVTVFTDPTDALYAFQLDPNSVDLLLTDQTMPYLSGAELAAVMLAIKPELPIILATGYSDSVNAEQAKRLGIRCYLHKPIEGKTLLDIIAAEFSHDGI